jgi:hypothetical protein
MLTGLGGSNGFILLNNRRYPFEEHENQVVANY